MAKLPTNWIDNSRSVSITASGNPTLLDEASATLLDEASATILQEDNIVTGKLPSAWS